MREVRSPWSRERGEAHPRLAESPGSRSSPSRADGGHVAGHVGKGGATRRDNVTGRSTNEPVQGGFRPPVEDRR